MTSRDLWNYYRDEINDDANKNTTKQCKSCEYKTELIGRTPSNKNILHADVVVLLKHLSKFWRYLDFPLINCEIELDFSWSKKCIISQILITPAIASNPKARPPAADIPAR